MQIPSGPVGAYGYFVRNYAPASLYPQYQGRHSESSAKPPGGKSFTIESLLAKPEDTTSDRTSTIQCGVKYEPAPPVLPFTGRTGLQTGPAAHTYTPNVWPSAIHTQPGYSALFCCPPFPYQSSCHGAFHAQASVSKVNVGLLSLKTKSGKSKRMRTSFTSDQLARLEKEFARQQYMVGSERFLLASSLQLTEAQVKVWFQNRRIKWRKQSLEQQQAKLAKLGLAAPPKSPGSQGNGGEQEEFSDTDVDIDVSGNSSDH